MPRWAALPGLGSVRDFVFPSFPPLWHRDRCRTHGWPHRSVLRILLAGGGRRPGRAPAWSVPPVRNSTAVWSRCAGSFGKAPAVPESGRVSCHAPVTTAARPATTCCPHPGHCRGSHSASYSPGLHPSNEHGIKTITGAKHAPKPLPAKGTRLRAPPSLLSIRFHAEKEPHPAPQGFGQFRFTTISDFFSLVESTS